MDPLSAHIIRRTSKLNGFNSAYSVPAVLVHGEPSRSLSSDLERVNPGEDTFPSGIQNRENSDGNKLQVDPGLKKARGLLSRIRLRRQQPANDAVSDRSGASSSSSATDVRNSLESGHSTLLAQLNNNAATTPPHGESYVKMKSKMKANKYFSHLVLAQTLATAAGTYASAVADRSGTGASGATWIIKFSKDGKYMATGGQSCIVYVWRVLSQEETTEDKIKVFEDVPIHEYRGHAADILDISWSKNNFLLSSSMDKTVRTAYGIHQGKNAYVFFGIWILSRALHSIQSIPEKKVAFWNEIPEGNMITAVGFTLDGNTACAGSYLGQVFFYETQGLKYNTQVSVKKRNARKGRKITGIEPMPGMAPGDEKILVSSNDSRIRLINMKDKSLMYKYKGNENLSMQIRATFSDDGRYIVCGSEDNSVYLWGTEQVGSSPFHYLQDGSLKAAAALGHFGEQLKHGEPQSSGWLKRGERKVKDKLRNRSEHFEAHQDMVTSTAFAPTKTRQILYKTGHDIIYNHTPVYAHILAQGNDDHSQQNTTAVEASSEAREKHNFADGQIIISADFQGCIKVWRMDSGVYLSQQPKRHSVDSSSLGSKSAFSGGEGSSTARRRPFVSLFSSRSSK
ncbi:hypothetical protein DFQ30_009566 [Apophysomyces sp. BC1015]|nr:hypothetical protein DFQ30_009566 [Apophysomyces sp. BC1015]